ncbi:MAG: type II toxin-antitoxin system RelE/ParE family toxin, partial [Gammaproteobacteria bacterium]|nr:type II toxin-antitoxin system RelE/ParE family toxin [Gammaproteobacteria bacterium]
LRELIRPPFRIVYRRDPKHVRVVRVWRSERPLDVLSG